MPSYKSPAPDKCLDEGSGASGLILGFPESVEAPKDASESGLSHSDISPKAFSYLKPGAYLSL